MPYLKFDLPKYPCTSDMWDEIAAQSRPIVVYGMGNGADKLIDRFEKYNIEIADFFASDGFVRGHSFHGKRVKAFSEIKAEYPDFVIVLSFASNRPEVIDMLAAIDSEYDMYVPDMPVADVEEYFDKNFYNENYEAICRAYSSLADEPSRNAFAAIVNYKLTGKMSYLLGAYCEKREMYEFISKREIRTYVDAGAYNGDTLKEAVEYFPSLSHAYAIEPDPKNFKKLEKYVATLEGISVSALNAAVWKEGGTGSFSSSGNRNSTASATASYEHKTESVTFVAIDEIVDSAVDYIKYDVEGAELEALLGSDEAIRKHAPTLLVSLYHKSRDIFSLVNYLSEKYGEIYSFFLHRLRCLPAWEIDLIAVPKVLQ